MLSLPSSDRRPRSIFLGIVLVALACPLMAQERVVVAVVEDGATDRFESQHRIYIDELLALTASEFDLEIRRFAGNWSKETIDAALSDA
ncbi:MAG: hypothetical protein OEM51_09360, partial [Gammaproteobacteria bacterium]|nr:hypothetical protein [Gammaproteobacteria bacterium]